MSTKERNKLKAKIIELIDKLFVHPRINEKRELGQALCQYFGVDAVEGIYRGLDVHKAIDELYPGATDRKSPATYKLCMRLSFVCTAAFAEKLDTARVAWRNVVAAMSTKLTVEESREWLEKLAVDRRITLSMIKASYGCTPEKNIRLPRNVEEGCEKFRTEAMRLIGYAKGLRARLTTRRSKRHVAEDEAVSLSIAELAAKSLYDELRDFLSEVNDRRHVVAEQPLETIRSTRTREA